MSSQQFRKLLEQFYMKINTGNHADVYKKILAELFDEVEVEPIHILAFSQQPLVKNFNKKAFPLKKQEKKTQALCKSPDFSAIFLFGYILGLLKRRDRQQLKNLQSRVFDNLSIFYREKQNQDSNKYEFLFEGVFQFCEYVMMHDYEKGQIEKLFKAFYSNTFQRRGLKKTERQKYLTESQAFILLILSQNGTFPSKKQLCQPNSDIYELNSLQFCINIDNIEIGQQWTIGEGENHINIVKQKGQYAIYQQKLENKEESDEEISQIWLQILSESQQIKRQQTQRTTSLMSDLNIIEELCSPTKSMRAPKSVMVNNRAKTKIGDFF